MWTRVVLKPERMEELGHWHQKNTSSTLTSVWWTPTSFHVFLHQCQWRLHPKLLHIQGQTMSGALHQRMWDWSMHSDATKCMNNDIFVWYVFGPLHCMCSKKKWKHVLKFGQPIPFGYEWSCKSCHGDVVNKAKAIGLDVITLPSHSWHALQPLDIYCFKNFKSTFRSCCDSWTSTHRGVWANKKDLANAMARRLKKAFTSDNINEGF